MRAVPLVIHQSEHGLREWIAHGGALTIEIERGLISLQDSYMKPSRPAARKGTIQFGLNRSCGTPAA
jgi:hypothetical protein